MQSLTGNSSLIFPRYARTRFYSGNQGRDRSLRDQVS